jgi:hypothetical protein
VTFLRQGQRVENCFLIVTLAVGSTRRISGPLDVKFLD